MESSLYQGLKLQEEKFLVPVSLMRQKHHMNIEEHQEIRSEMCV